MLSLLKNLSSLSVNKPSKHPTAIDSVHIATTDFGEENAAARDAEEPLVTDVVVKHSSAFNSERASGMKKVQQFQFVELIKGMIIGTSSRYKLCIMWKTFVADRREWERRGANCIPSFHALQDRDVAQGQGESGLA
jgi:hypothetical protein